VQTPGSDGGVDEFALTRCAPSPSGEPTIPPGEQGCFTTRTGAAMHEECIHWGTNLEFVFEWNGPTPRGAIFIPHCELSDRKDVDCPEL
jgi:hypothetical protein